MVKKYFPQSQKNFFDFLQTIESKDNDDEINRNFRSYDEEPILVSRGPEKIDYYFAAKKSFKEFYDFIVIAKLFFEKADWNENYGGPRWANIADAYFRLASSKSVNQKIIAIDHLYDLEHNTGSIFTKDNSFDKLSKIKKALDFKSQVKSIKELLDKVSSSMNKLASRIIHIKNIQ
jgi:hypothetical protein